MHNLYILVLSLLRGMDKTILILGKIESRVFYVIYNFT